LEATEVLKSAHTLSGFLLVTLFLASGCAQILDATSKKPIEENRGKRTLGNVIDDERIETVVTVNIRKADPQLKQAHINVISFNGVILLVGQIPTPELREQAALVAEQSRGVRQVHNELTVSGPISTLAITNDSWITTKIKSKFVANRDIDSARVKVVTENGVVYLMGLFTQAEAEMLVSVARDTRGVQKIVRVFELIE
jgi:osmotically-inducible protein OsmY